MADYRINVLRHGLRHQTFRYFLPGEPDIVWDINAAENIIRRGTAGALGFLELPAPQPIPPDQMRSIAEKNAWDPAMIHLADPSVPGIAAPLINEGAIMWVLIDGMHRNARALRDGLPFAAWLLSDQGSRLCLLTDPRPDRIP